jgi:hypothetical protein
VYRVINEHADLVVSDHRLGPAVDEYLWLMRAAPVPGMASDLEFRRKYRAFWQLGAARLGEEWVEAHFDLMERASQQRLDIRDVITALSLVPRNAAGGYAVDLSFASKLVHMHEPKAPIYDALIADFFLYKAPTTGTVTVRVENQLEFYSFLVKEYRRIHDDGLLVPVVEACRARFGPVEVSAEKWYDFAIWTFVRLARAGRILNGSIRYS